MVSQSPLRQSTAAEMLAHASSVNVGAISAIALLICLSVPGAATATEGVIDDGSVLPFPTPPSASTAGPTLQESTLVPFPVESHLPKDAPNILIIMLDDVGFGLPDTFGGPIHTPTLSRLANDGISYNAFHTT
jgi:arylsulfatase